MRAWCGLFVCVVCFLSVECRKVLFDCLYFFGGVSLFFSFTFYHLCGSIGEEMLVGEFFVYACQEGLQMVELGCEFVGFCGGVDEVAKWDGVFCCAGDEGGGAGVGLCGVDDVVEACHLGYDLCDGRVEGGVVSFSCHLEGEFLFVGDVFLVADVADGGDDVSCCFHLP